jgi:hypothetical protein
MCDLGILRLAYVSFQIFDDDDDDDNNNNNNNPETSYKSASVFVTQTQNMTRRVYNF